MSHPFLGRAAKVFHFKVRKAILVCISESDVRVLSSLIGGIHAKTSENIVDWIL